MEHAVQNINSPSVTERGQTHQKPWTANSVWDSFNAEPNKSRYSMLPTWKLMQNKPNRWGLIPTTSSPHKKPAKITQTHHKQNTKTVSPRRWKKANAQRIKQSASISTKTTKRDFNLLLFVLHHNFFSKFILGLIIWMELNTSKLTRHTDVISLVTTKIKVDVKFSPWMSLYPNNNQCHKIIIII